jgi:tetratricopeptide (TPR) repeat protein
MILQKTVLLLLFICSYLVTIAQEPAAIKEYNAGLKYYNLNNYADASPFFENAIRKDPTFVNAYKILISCQEQLGQRQLVIKNYEKVIDLSPSDKKSCYNLALTYLEIKDYDRTIVYLKKALQIDLGYTKAANKLKEIEAYLAKEQTKKYEATQVEETSLEKTVYQQALVLYRQKAYQKALSKLESFSEEITLADFYYLKAISYQNIGKRTEGIENYELALEVNDRHFNSNLNLGTIYYNDQQYEEAVQLLETAYDRRPNDMPLLFSLGQAQYHAGDYEAAIEHLNDYTARKTKDGEAWLLLGKSYSALKKSKNAAKAFDMAQKYGSQDDAISDKLNNAISKFGKQASELTQNGNYQGAIEILEKAIEEHSEEASLYFNLGLNYMEVGNYKKARKAFTKTIDLDASHAKAYQGLGLIYYEKGEFSMAAAYYQATIDAGKFDEYVYYKLGSCLYKLKRVEEAVVAYEEAVKINPSIKQFYFGLALAYIGIRANKKSVAMLRKALELDQGFLDAQYHICVNYIEMNRYDDCIAEANLILKKDDLYAKAYLAIAHSYKRKGEYLKAEKYQDKAVELDPTLRD